MDYYEFGYFLSWMITSGVMLGILLTVFFTWGKVE